MYCVSIQSLIYLSLLCHRAALLSKNYSKHINGPHTMKLTEHSEVEVPLGTQPTAGLHRNICAFKSVWKLLQQIEIFHFV